MDKIKRLLEFSVNLLIALTILLAPTIANAIMIPLLRLSVWNVVIEGLTAFCVLPAVWMFQPGLFRYLLDKE
jgi:hypothetical protein